MSDDVPPIPRPRLRAGDVAWEVRKTLFGLCIAAGYGLAACGLFSGSAVIPRRFGEYCMYCAWAGGVYAFVLAARLIWLPDDRLKRASRNLLTLIGAVCGVVFIALPVASLIGNVILRPHD